MSTSNEIAGDNATVTTDKPALWTIEFRKHIETLVNDEAKNSR